MYFVSNPNPLRKGPPSSKKNGTDYCNRNCNINGNGKGSGNGNETKNENKKIVIKPAGRPSAARVFNEL